MTGQYRSEPDITEFLFGGFISKVQSMHLKRVRDGRVPVWVSLEGFTMIERNSV
jgi:hypothetical protein